MHVESPPPTRLIENRKWLAVAAFVIGGPSIFLLVLWFMSPGVAYAVAGHPRFLIGNILIIALAIATQYIAWTKAKRLVTWLLVCLWLTGAISSLLDSSLGKDLVAEARIEAKEKKRVEAAKAEKGETLLAVSIPAKGKSKEVNFPSFAVGKVDCTATSIVAEIYDSQKKLIRQVDTTGASNFGERNNFEYLPDNCTAVFWTADGAPGEVTVKTTY